MADDATFDLTLERIALIRRMAVAWNPAGCGAPILNPQAPYGSLDRAEDISNVTGDDEGTDEEHRALGEALAVFVANAALKPGRYAYHNPLAKLPPEEMLDLFRDEETGASPEHVTFDVSAEHLALLRHLAVRWDAENDVPAIDTARPYGGSGDLYAEMRRHLGSDAASDHLAELHREMQPALQNLLRHADIAPGPFARRVG
ncbi:hypothetical protein [Methylobacterium sp. sgz302541]|uniref:hypothetical protein n=1 Tax=unclassified Methylobacterium TaxID=2615210 RepID=UPI003D33EA88